MWVWLSVTKSAHGWGDWMKKCNLVQKNPEMLLDLKEKEMLGSVLTHY